MKANNKKTVKSKTSKNTDNRISSKKPPKKFNRKKRVLVFFITIVLIGLICYSIYYLCTSPTFYIKQILVEGNERYTYEQIITNPDENIGKNIFTYSGSKVKAQAKTLPYINNVSVIKKYPDKVIIKVEERKSKFFAYDKDKNTYYRLSLDGIILEQTNVDQKSADEILTHGVTFDDEVVLGETINEADISKLVVFQKIEDECKKNDINMPITKVSYENSLTIITINGKLNVVFPNDTNLKYNVSFLKEILANISDAEGIIDLTKSNPTFSTM